MLLVTYIISHSRSVSRPRTPPHLDHHFWQSGKASMRIVLTLTTQCNASLHVHKSENIISPEKYHMGTFHVKVCQLREPLLVLLFYVISVNRFRSFFVFVGTFCVKVYCQMSEVCDPLLGLLFSWVLIDLEVFLLSGNWKKKHSWTQQAQNIRSAPMTGLGRSYLSVSCHSSYITNIIGTRVLQSDN